MNWTKLRYPVKDRSNSPRLKAVHEMPPRQARAAAAAVDEDVAVAVASRLSHRLSLQREQFRLRLRERKWTSHRANRTRKNSLRLRLSQRRLRQKFRSRQPRRNVHRKVLWCLLSGCPDRARARGSSGTM